MNLFLIWIVVCLAILIGQIYLLGRRMSEPEKLLRPITGPLSPRHEAVIQQHQEWLNSVGLEFRTSFQFGSVHVAVFQQGDQPRFFSFLCHQRITFSAESYLEDMTILDTSNSGNLGLFPRPGAYAQSFPALTAEAVWELHLEGEAELTRKFGYRWKPINRPYEEIFFEAVRIRMNYNRSQAFWPVRVLYGFFVTRFTIRNKTIAQQFP